jgi:hypothetical protein
MARPALRTRAEPDRPPHEEVWLRVVDGRPVSAVTTRFLACCCAKPAAGGETARCAQPPLPVASQIGGCPTGMVRRTPPRRSSCQTLPAPGLAT